MMTEDFCQYRNLISNFYFKIKINHIEIIIIYHLLKLIEIKLQDIVARVKTRQKVNEKVCFKMYRFTSTVCMCCD